MSTPRRALIVIDAQQEYFEGLLPIQYPARDASRARIAEAMDAAEQAGIPAVVVQHKAPAGFPVFAPESATFALHPEIAKRAENAAHRFTKPFASIFAGTGLEAWLRCASPPPPPFGAEDCGCAPGAFGFTARRKPEALRVCHASQERLNEATAARPPLGEDGARSASEGEAAYRQ